MLVIRKKKWQSVHGALSSIAVSGSSVFCPQGTIPAAEAKPALKIPKTKVKQKMVLVILDIVVY